MNLIFATHSQIPSTDMHVSSFVASLATKILSRYLGDYVEGLDSKNLEISLLSGSVELRNLKLKTSSLEKLDLPVTVKEGAVQFVSYVLTNSQAI